MSVSLKSRITVLLFSMLFITIGYAQSVPAGDENIPYLMTFGPEAPTSWGDDDFSQTFFFRVPESYNKPIFIRVFDPDVGGKHDEQNGEWDTRMVYSVYGGEGCYTNIDAQKTDPIGEYKSGTLLATKSFTQSPRFDNNWYTFGPFNPTEGEYYDKYQGYIFKVITEGVSGNDGNMYRFFLSISYNENVAIEGGNAFAYEYSFRMHDDPNQVSHIYPYVDDRTVSIKLSNFDWDNDGFIRIVSVARRGQMSQISGDDHWVEDEFKIFEEEKNSSLDIQFIKQKHPPVKNNNVVVNVRNQYNELLPFFVIPIGGVPKYKYTIKPTKIE